MDTGLFWMCTLMAFSLLASITDCLQLSFVFFLRLPTSIPTPMRAMNPIMTPTVAPAVTALVGPEFSTVWTMPLEFVMVACLAARTRVGHGRALDL